MKKIAALLMVVMMVYGLTAGALTLDADFYWEPEAPTDMEGVHFFDNSTGDVVAWVWYFGDGSSSTEQNPVHQYQDNGTYTVRLVIFDSSDNMDYVEKNITVFNVPPVAVAGENITSNDLLVMFNGSMSYDVDGTIVNWTWLFGDGNAGFGETLNHTYGAEGIYTVNLTVFDNDGANDTDAITALVDITPPETNYSIEGERAWYNDTVTVNLSATDNLAGVNATWYRIDNGNWTQYEGNITITQEGPHTIFFYSTDVAGNMEDEHNITVNIDYTPPETTYDINATYGKNGWINEVARITLAATDNLSGVNTTWYKIDDGDWQKYEGKFNLSANGVHVIHFYSIDHAGNAEDEQNFTLKIDKNAPTVSITTPEKGYIYIFNRRILPTIFGNTIIIGKCTLAADADDTTSGIDYVEFMLNGEILWKDYAAPYEIQAPQNILLSSNKLKVIAHDKAGHLTETDELAYIKIF